MRARVGDRVVVESKAETARRREGEILEVRGENGGPPYVVRWRDGHEALYYPGWDAKVLSSH
jgi:hypothetical protein